MANLAVDQMPNLLQSNLSITHNLLALNSEQLCQQFKFQSSLLVTVLKLIDDQVGYRCENLINTRYLAEYSETGLSKLWLL